MLEHGPTRQMHVLFAIQQGDPSPGPRYRVGQFLPTYRKAGIVADVATVQSPASTARSLRAVSLSPPARATHLAWTWFESQRFMRRLPALAREYDRLYLYRLPIAGWAARQLTPYRNRLVYDFDDALDASEGTTMMARMRRRVWMDGLRHAITCCHTIVTSNERNAEVIRQLGGHAVVVPTCVDLQRYRVHEHAGARSPVVLGWIGTPSTAVYLPLIAEPLARLAAQRRIEILLIGSGGNPLPDLPVTVLPWREEAEIDQIADFDIGLMPMPDTAWTRGKAALKGLQYGAAGLPTVASWTSTNEQILGTAGGTFLCRDAGAWDAALRQLVDDASVRTAMGQRARQHVAAHYSVAANAPTLLDVLRR